MASITVKLDSPVAKIAVAVAAVLGLVIAFVFSRWLIATTVASRAEHKEIAEIGVLLGPSDPQTHLVYAALLEKTFFPDDLPRSLREYERAVSLSPNDHRLWLELGSARARIGDDNGAESAMRKSLELAPNYARVNWTLGNFLLRKGRTDEAFGLIRAASNADPQYASPAITGAWQVFGGDLDRVRGLAGDSKFLNAALANVLSKAKRFDEASSIWGSLPEADRNETFKTIGDEMLRDMLEAKNYRGAVRLSGGRFGIGSVHNAGFESDFTLQAPSDFEWRISDGVAPQIAVDPSQKRDGNRSLVLLFGNSDSASIRELSQTVAIEPGRNYVLRGFYRTDLKTSSTVRWMIENPVDGRSVAETESLDAQTDWKEFSVRFSAPEGADGVRIVLKRAPCKSSICPISGKIWLDALAVSEETK